MLWSVQDCTNYAVLGESTVAVMYHSSLNGGASIQFLDAITGEKNREDIFIPVASSGVSVKRFSSNAFSAETGILLEGGDWDHDYIYICDPETGETEVLDPFTHWEENMWSSLSLEKSAITDQGDILAMISDGSGSMNGRYVNMTITSPAVTTVLCFDGETRELRWRQTITSYSYSSVRTMEMIPGTDVLICQKDNTLAALDVLTGEVLSECKTLANILSIFVENGQVRGLLDDGGSFVYYYDEGKCSTLQFMDDDLAQAEYTGDYFTRMSNSTHITVYRTPERPNWQSMPELEGYIDWAVPCGGMLAVMADSFYMVDLNTQKIKWTADFEPGYGMDPLGLSADGSHFYIKYRQEIISVNTADGTSASIALPTTVGDQEGSICGFWTFGEERLHYIIRVEKTLYLSSLELATMEQKTYLLRQGTDEDGWSIGNNTGAARAAGDCVWIWDDGSLLSFSVSNGSFRVLLENLEAYPLCTWHEKEALLSVCVGNSVIFFNSGGKEVGRLSMGTEKAVSVCIRDRELLVINDENCLMRFDSTGTVLSENVLNVYTSFYNNIVPKDGKEQDIRWYFTKDGELILDVFGIGNIIDCTQWGCRAYIVGHVAYNPIQDTFLVESDYGRGWFQRYSTQQALEEGKRQLNGYELPEDKKASYGIQ